MRVFCRRDGSKSVAEKQKAENKRRHDVTRATKDSLKMARRGSKECWESDQQR